MAEFRLEKAVRQRRDRWVSIWYELRRRFVYEKKKIRARRSIRIRENRREGIIEKKV